MIYGRIKMTYRTKTYIAGDWTGDKDAIDKLYEWNNSKRWSLSFTDAHDLTQARDDSLNCNIKKSLKERMDASKTFVLIVGDKTNNLTAGSCQYCDSYNSHTNSCAKRYSIDYKSYIEYECNEAVKADVKIVVLYNSTIVSKDKCPKAVRNTRTHIPMKCRDYDDKVYWNYNDIKKAMEN